MSNKVRVVMPNKYDLVVGDTFQLFYRGIVEAPNPYVYSIVVVCEKGKAFPRYFEYTPNEVGKHKLTVSIYDAEQNLLGSAKTLLNVVEAKKPDDSTNILVIGDSLTNSGAWVEEVHRRINKTGGTPEGLGFDGAINFVGNVKKGEVGFEAFGGWSWHTFTSCSDGAVWLECPNNRTEVDQHSLWQDENGAIWQIETIQIDYIKFNRWKDHTSPMPKSGKLVHYKNAVNTEPIEYKNVVPEASSPFLDKETKEIDFRSYMKRSNIDKIDAVYILLGGNGLMRRVAIENTWEDYCKYYVGEAKVLVDKIRKDLPNAKVKVMCMHIPSVNGGMGANYGAELPLADHYDNRKYYNYTTN